MSLNKVMLIGRLGKDPEVRRMNNGNQVVSFSLATSESWRDKQTGERREKTEWHNVVIFNENIGKIAEQYCKKGSQIYLEGSLATRKWEKDGQDRYSTEIVLQNFNGTLKLLGDKRDGDGGSRGDDRGDDRGGGRDDRRSDPKPSSSKPSGGGADIDDDIPF